MKIAPEKYKQIMQDAADRRAKKKPASEKWCSRRTDEVRRDQRVVKTQSKLTAPALFVPVAVTW